MKAIVPGSYDPITLGHEQLIRRAASLFDEVTVLVGYNRSKTGFLSVENRLLLCRTAVSDLPNVRVDADDGMLADYCLSHGIGVCVKGVRNAEDFNYEASMARYNSDLLPGLETVLLAAPAEVGYISSSGVRTLISFGKNPEKYLSPAVFSLLRTMVKVN